MMKRHMNIPCYRVALPLIIIIIVILECCYSETCLMESVRFESAHNPTKIKICICLQIFQLCQLNLCFIIMKYVINNVITIVKIMLFVQRLYSNSYLYLSMFDTTQINLSFIFSNNLCCLGALVNAIQTNNSK